MSTEKPYPIVAICIPVYDHPKTCFWRSLNRLWKPSSASIQFERRGGTHTLDVQGFLVEQARRILTAQALEAEPKVDYILFVDDDMEFPPHALKQLLDHNLPIVGGLCHSRRPPFHPILCKKHHEEERGYGFCYHYPPNSLFEVDVTGGAFVLIKREVFEEISEKFGAGKWWDPRNGRSEDFSFFERAQECGYKVFVDTGLEIGHLTELILYSENAKKLRTYQWEPWNPDPGVQKGSEGKLCASIIIPAYNQKPKYLKSAIQSASHQTVPVEVIVVDDGSDTPIPFEGWPENVRVLRHVKDPIGGATVATAVKNNHLPSQNRGISAALNTGIKDMKTDWFCWLSSDDILDPRKVQLQLAQLKQADGKLGFHRFQVIDPLDPGFARVADLISWTSMDQQQKVLAQVCAINGSTVMIHKSVFENIGLFDTEFKYGQDYEFWCRAAQRYFWYPLDEILGTRRERGNLTEQIETSAKDDPRRLQRDAEDSAIRARYGVRP